jgi:molybdopterin/thiamine biosynthesis adenylyltransferase
MALRQKRKVNISIRLTKELYDSILADLKRPHAHASERVGFTYGKLQTLSIGEYLILMTKYEPVDDKNYIKDRSVGAHINSDAILVAMQAVLGNTCGAFHTHMHWGSGIPDFSGTDMSGLPKVVNSFRVGSQQAHGMFLLNHDSLNCLVWIPGIEKPVYADKISIVGYQLKHFYPNSRRIPKMPGRLDRQSFLGKNSHWYLHQVKIGIVGLGGGGSHIMQQLAHLGVGNYVLCDPDSVEDSNLNRMVGSNANDAKKKTSKVQVSKRIIKAVLPDANVFALKAPWENCAEHLQSCDIVVGCVDTVAGRRDLEAACRRYLIPLIDIGMDVYESKTGFDVRGQVILSMPGDVCFQCYDFVNEENLKKEAEKYGAAGGRPQVVWSNGVLASTAIGILVDLITGWSTIQNRRVYLSYNGNDNTVKPHTREEFPLQQKCSHYKLDEIGPVVWKKLGNK